MFEESDPKDPLLEGLPQAQRRRREALKKVLGEDQTPVPEKRRLFKKRNLTARSGGSIVADEDRVVRLRELSSGLGEALQRRVGYHWSRLDRAVFLRKLSVSIQAGLPIVKALEILGSSSDRDNVREALGNALKAVSSGEPLHDALGHTPLFTPTQLAAIQAGSASGTLDRSLASLAQSEEAAVNMSNRILSKLIYPSVLVVFLWLSLVVMVVCLGRLLKLFVETLPTAQVSPGARELAAVLSANWAPWLVLIVPPILIALALPHLRKLLPQTLTTSYDAVRVARLLAQLLEVGVPLMDSLTLAAKVGWKDECLKTQQSIQAGLTLAQSLPERFPRLLRDLAMVGEESGNLATMLLKAAQMLEDDFLYRVEILVGLIEPLMCASFGALLGGLCLVCLVPLVRMMQAL